MVDTDMAKDLQTRLTGLVGEETTASYYVSARTCALLCEVSQPDRL